MSMVVFFWFWFFVFSPLIRWVKTTNEDGVARVVDARWSQLRRVRRMRTVTPLVWRSGSVRPRVTLQTDTIYLFF